MVLFVCSCVREQDYCTSKKWILLKLGVTIEHTDGRYQLAFVVIWSWIWILDHFSTSFNPYSGSLFYFLQHWVLLVDLLAYLTVTARFSQNSAKLLMQSMEWIRYILEALEQTPRSGSIWKSGFESQITFGWGNRSSGGQAHLALAEVPGMQSKLSSYRMFCGCEF